MKPWEKYAAPAETPAGPWAKYGGQSPAAPQEPGLLDSIKQGAGNVVAGAVRGAGSIGATVLTPIDAAARALGIENSFIGRTDRREAMDQALTDMGAETDSIAFGAGKLGAEIAGTAGAGGVIAKPLQAVAPRLASSIASAGLTTGGPAGTTLATRAADMGLRATGGAISGAATAGIVNPGDAGSGAVIGAALPGALKVAGSAGRAVERTIHGPTVPDPIIQAARAARQAGYVIPPSAASPTLVNRVVEGSAGKTSVQQSASLRNQEITNRLAREALGVDELTPQAIAALRQRMNSAYDSLGRFGTISVDDGFRAAVEQAGGRSRAFAQDFPELADPAVDKLINAMTAREGFDSQSAIEVIKRLRHLGGNNKAAIDPAARQLGDAQMKVSAAIEDLIERNLATQGADDLLTQFRNARQTLARAYDVEKSLTPTGNVDAARMASLLNKGRPLTGELRQIGEFASTFKNAARTPESMGSVPGMTPLDWTEAGALSVFTGSPLAAVNLARRPVSRAIALSGPVQNRLGQEVPQATSEEAAGWLANPANREALELLFLRSLPVAATSGP